MNILNGKYQVYKDIAGKHRFRLLAANNKIVAVSQSYESKVACMDGVKSVKTNCNSHVEDKTVEMENLINPKYEIFMDTDSKFRFHLKASNGEIIAASEGYESKQGVQNGIEAVQKSCDAEIEDLTVSQEDEDKKLAETVEKSCYAGVTTKKITYVPYNPVEVCKEPVSGVHATSIELFATPSSVDSGNSVTFRGKLMNKASREGIGCVTVHIFESDRSFLRDDFLAHGQTESDGTFAINWTAKQKDFWDDKIQVYAKFIGTEHYTPTRSDVHKIQVLWYAKRK